MCPENTYRSNKSTLFELFWTNLGLIWPPRIRNETFRWGARPVTIRRHFCRFGAIHDFTYYKRAYRVASLFRSQLSDVAS